MKMLISSYTRNQILCFIALIITLTSLTESRYHHHKEKHKHNSHNHHSSKPEPPSSSISQPPTPPPGPDDSPSPSLPPSPSDDPEEDNNGVYDVRKFGAVGDGAADDTEAFKTAWDSSCSNGNDTVSVLLVPYGYTFMIQSTIFTGPCHSYQLFQVDGTIVTPDGPESWPSNISKRQWLVFYRVNGMALKGAGVIDGRGQKWWDLPCKPHRTVNKSAIVAGPCDSPIALRFFMSSNLTVEGLQIKNSPQFHFRFDGCQGVHVESLHITAPPLSPNTDGIHIENSNSVTIYNSVISNGDDCVSIGSGSYDVDIRNLTCGPGGHGISIGSLGNHNSHACVSNITVRDSVIKYSNNGVRIKTWQGGFGSVSGVTFNNIHVESVRNPIIIDQYYCMTKDCANKTSAVFVSDITYQGIKGTYDIRSPPMHFGCSDAVPCTNLTLSGIELLPAKGEIVVDPFCWNAYGIVEELSIPPVWCLMSDPPTALQGALVNKCGSP
ncbi:unnamed protein product [Brassica oleracea var. botrytis]|nr:PREDICTED: polygalacturonase At1g48100-like [Brassica oleracea var. oleracea]XP_013647753.2 polygalacturonase At1g48100-like [Brassica napus]KAH0866703.1 hypothetical protein HID58_083914 [Brassica napus]CAF2116944.1 unnamed protein product [Brassica napus]